METKGGILSVAFLRRLPYIPPDRVTLSHPPETGARGVRSLLSEPAGVNPEPVDLEGPGARGLRSERRN